MGYKEVQLNLSIELFEQEINNRILKMAGVREGSVSLLRKSLDSRKKNNIVWNILAGVTSVEIKEGETPSAPHEALEHLLEENHKKRNERALVVGSGPAGIFAGLILLRLGYKVTIIERGAPVEQRANLIKEFEEGGSFSERGNYLFGEGGAGTFSDGKLTSRTKKIVMERDWIHSTYVSMGGPKEILWSTHPHLGSDKLFTIAQNMRSLFEQWGGEILFNTTLRGMKSSGGRVHSLETDKGELEADLFYMAMGHSAQETYRMLIDQGVPFKSKNFAIGFRMEHLQRDINLSQWGVETLPGVKAAEYRLTHKSSAGVPVYTFCMCPGGIVVPSAAYERNNLVNGMSYYARDGKWSNAALVAGITPADLGLDESDPLAMLDWLDSLESRFKEIAPGYQAPSCSIEEFLSSKSPTTDSSSYPLGLKEWDLASELPKKQIEALKEGLMDFTKRMPLLGQGRLLGLESKTSAPLQVNRDKSGRPLGWENLWVCGEGSGWAGGIISSAADGIRAALSTVDSPK